ncbi:MAG: hypothetical protein NT080_12905 [Spirochaetes bacterium]|nr:hypothetical protein [Spirochaetota bacterium]
MKRTALIIYEDERDRLASLAGTLQKALTDAGFSARCSEASKTGIPDVLASSVFAFGASTKELASFHELRRLFSGVNLAGRKALLFTDGAASAVGALKAMLEDSEISVHPDAFKQGSDVSAWLDFFSPRPDSPAKRAK